MAGASSTAASSPASSSPIHSGPHRRRLNDIEHDAPDAGPLLDDDDDRHHHHSGHDAAAATSALGAKALLLARRKRVSPVADLRAWMRGVVVCLLCLVAVVGFLGSHRGGGGGRLVQRLEVADAEMLELTEENLTASARRLPDFPVHTSRR